MAMPLVVQLIMVSSEVVGLITALLILRVWMEEQLPLLTVMVYTPNAPFVTTGFCKFEE